MANRTGHPFSPIARHSSRASPASPRTGSVSAPVNNVAGSPPLPLVVRNSSSSARFTTSSPVLHAGRQRSFSSVMSSSTAHASSEALQQSSVLGSRPRSRSRETESSSLYSPKSTPLAMKKGYATTSPRTRSPGGKKTFSDASAALAKARGRNAQKENDSMVYLDGPQVYTCGQCRTHLTSHDDIISKSFHGRHGRAYLFDQCVNITVGPAEDRLLITGLHSVCDIYCKRCKGMIGWTYAKAYESSQKYKEGKFIIEKINLHLEESNYYDVSHPAGERPDRWRLRSMSWGSEASISQSPRGEAIVYEYRPPTATASLPNSPRYWERSPSSHIGSSSVSESPLIRPGQASSSTTSGAPPAPPFL